MAKYQRLHERLIRSGVVDPSKVFIPRSVSNTDLLRAHDPHYVYRAIAGILTYHEVRRIGFPWSPDLIERSRRSAGATVDAAMHALQHHTVAINLAGGTHHACRDHGQGFCVFNDSAIAALHILEHYPSTRILILDLDVHQGNGTADILAVHPSIFTCSFHGERNFPFHKVPSDLDVPLPDHTDDDLYLQTLSDTLPQLLHQHRPHLILYLAGVDPYHGDRLGRLNLTKHGLAERDELVFSAAHRYGAAVSVSMSGGYAPDIDTIVSLHLQTIEIASHYA